MSVQNPRSSSVCMWDSPSIDNCIDGIVPPKTSTIVLNLEQAPHRTSSPPRVISDENYSRVSYAQALHRGPISTNQDSILPVRKGDNFSITIDEGIYQKRVSKYESTLIGRLVLSKCNKPWVIIDLKSWLQDIWRLQNQWKVIPLGRGFFNIQFGSSEDRGRASTHGIWNVKPGTLRLTRWTPNFNPYKLSTSITQFWIRIYELSIEYWYSSVILGIARAIGVPLKIDERSLNGSLGHFVRVLVEVDLNLPL